MNGDDHFSSKISVGGLLNTDKVNLVGSITNNDESISIFKGLSNS